MNSRNDCADMRQMRPTRFPGSFPAASRRRTTPRRSASTGRSKKSNSASASQIVSLRKPTACWFTPSADYSGAIRDLHAYARNRNNRRRPIRRVPRMSAPKVRSVRVGSGPSIGGVTEAQSARSAVGEVQDGTLVTNGSMSPFKTGTSQTLWRALHVWFTAIQPGLASQIRMSALRLDRNERLLRPQRNSSSASRTRSASW